jgi:hypothetical protein
MADGELYTVFVDSSPALPLPPNAGDQIAIVRNGVTYQVAPTDISAGGSGIGFTTYVTPSDGDTITATLGQGRFVITPAGDLAALHLVMPPSPADEGVFTVSCTKTITAFDAVGSAGDSMASSSGGPFLFGANGGWAWIYQLATTTWFPLY